MAKRTASGGSPGRKTSIHNLDALFRGFSDPSRIRILNVLAAGELCVCDIVELLGFPQPTVSRHLAYLRRSGLVEARPELRFTYYKLADPDGVIHGDLIDCVRKRFTGVSGLEAERKEAERRVIQRKAIPCR